MKFLKQSLIFTLFLMGIFSIYKLDFLNRTVLITKVDQFEARRNSGHKKNAKYMAHNKEKQISSNSNISHRRVAPSKDIRGRQNGRTMQKRNKWSIKFNFQAGMVNVMYYTSILALFVMIVYWADQKIRCESN